MIPGINTLQVALIGAASTVVASVLAGAYGYYKGSEEQKEIAKVAKQAAETRIANLESKLATAQGTIVKEFVKGDTIIKTRTEYVVKEITVPGAPTIIYRDGVCNYSHRFARLYNESVGYESSESGPRPDDSPAEATTDQINTTIIKNNGICLAEINKLEALQKVVLKYQALFPARKD